MLLNCTCFTKLATTSSIDVTGTAVTDFLRRSGNVSVDGGTPTWWYYPTGTDNVALGNGADSGSLNGSYNVAIGTDVLTENTTIIEIQVLEKEFTSKYNRWKKCWCR